MFCEFICTACGKNKHQWCKRMNDKSWCDCQHKPRKAPKNG